jgi:alanyl-tRNA synthetase
LSVLPADLPGAIERLQADGRELRKQIKDFQSTLAVQEADALADGAVMIRGLTVVAAALPGWDAAGLKAIASRIVERTGHLAILVSEPPPAAVVVARAADLAIDAAALLKQLVKRHGGNGGGRPELAQGGGVTSPARDVLQSARELITQ